MFYIENGNLKFNTLYNSVNQNESATNALRPVVEIDLSKVNVGATGDGTRDNAYSITAK